MRELKNNLPQFMREHGFPIKAMACSGEEAPEELSDNGMINTAGYSWDPLNDTMKIMIPKLFIGEKKKGRYTPGTSFFEVVFGSFIWRRALIESGGDPLKEVGEVTKKMFLQYVFQVQMLNNLTFARNKYLLEKSEDDVLVLCTDAGFHASMIILYLAHKVDSNLKLEFVFSIGNLNNDSGNIPRAELDIME